MLTVARRSRNVSSSWLDRRRPRAGRAAYCAGEPGSAPGDAEVDELAEAVFDVQAHAPERRHQRLDVERLVGTRAQETQQARAQRRLHERTESRLESLRIGRRAECDGMVATLDILGRLITFEGLARLSAIAGTTARTVQRGGEC